jgi:hypothetical protein
VCVRDVRVSRPKLVGINKKVERREAKREAKALVRCDIEMLDCVNQCLPVCAQLCVACI